MESSLAKLPNTEAKVRLSVPPPCGAATASSPGLGAPDTVAILACGTQNHRMPGLLDMKSGHIHPTLLMGKLRPRVGRRWLQCTSYGQDSRFSAVFCFLFGLFLFFLITAPPCCILLQRAYCKYLLSSCQEALWGCKG